MMQKHAIARAVSGARWNPRDGLIGGDTGLWLDPSDLTTMFQDSAGTTPVTALEQQVGLMLDKGKGLVFGPELVTNGDFSNGTTGWSGQANVTISTENGELKGVTSSSFFTFAYQDEVTVSGKWYKATATLRCASGNMGLEIYNGAFATKLAGATLTTPTATTTISIYFVATGTSTRISFGTTTSAATTYYADNISVRELPGNHAFQSTSANRPMLSARYNLLTKTEDFSDAGWNLNSDTIVSTNVAQTTDPIGGNSADKLIASNTTNYHWRQQQLSLNMTANNYFASVYVKAGEYSKGFLGIQDSSSDFSQATLTFDLVTKTLGYYTIGTGVFVAGSESIVSLPNGWFKVSFIGRSGKNSATNGVSVYLIDDSWAASFRGNGVNGFYVWGASLVPADQAALPYQRVNTVTDYDSDQTKFPRRINYAAGQSMTVNFPANLGISCVVARANPGVSAVIAENQTVNTPLTLNTNHSGLVITSRAISVDEKARLDEYLDKKAIAK